MPFTVTRFIGTHWLAIAVGVLAGGALLEDITTPRVALASGTYDRGPEPVIIAALIGVTVLIWFRPRLGVIAPLGGQVLLAVAAIWANAWVLNSPFVFIFGMLLCAAAGYSAKRPLEYAGLLVLWAVASFDTSRDPGSSLALWVVVLMYMTSAWVVGIVARNVVVKGLLAEERAVRVEQERHELSRRAVIEERRRIARELHDIIAHSVSVMTVQTGAVRRLLSPAQERERDALLAVERTGREALAEMRRLVGLLKQEEEEDGQGYTPQPGMQSLDTLLGTVRNAGLEVDVSVEGQRRDLPPGVDLTAFRVLQEALTNAMKHARPPHATVHLRWSPDQLDIEVANEGRGRGRSGGGYGHVGMKERLALYGGHFESGARADGGYVVRASLPIGDEK